MSSRKRGCACNANAPTGAGGHQGTGSVACFDSCSKHLTSVEFFLHVALLGMF